MERGGVWADHQVIVIAAFDHKGLVGFHAFKELVVQLQETEGVIVDIRTREVEGLRCPYEVVFRKFGEI